MQCPKCNTGNRGGAKFCLKCGTSLALVCAKCGRELPPEAMFCDACGAQVGAPPAEAGEEPGAPVLDRAIQRLVPREFADRLLATRGQVGKERRMVTILFSDVKGSTAMAESLDPEDVMEIMDGAFDVLIEPIYRYEGTLARLMGDAILAFFGAPIAHEDDPERACRAALEIIEGAQRYAARLEEERGISGFNVRVGINTGLVVVGEVGSDLRVEYTAMGDAVNLAARMESAAEAGTILTTEDTHKFIAPLFETEALGQKQVKGKAEPVAVYRVLASKMAPGKLRGVAGLESPLVGREVEFAALREAVERLRVGVGGIVTIVGEAGLGKSRLVAELRNQASADLQWVEGRCLSYGASIAYLLWLDVLRGLLGVTAEDAPVAVRDALRERVQVICPEHFDNVYPYLGWLMSLPLTTEEETLLQGLEGEKLKAGTFRAVETLIECAVSERPLVLVCEDLHWADPTSIELLEQLLALTDRASLLILCVFRPERERSCWRIKEAATRLYPHRHTDLWLDPLSASESEALVGNLLEVEGLPQKLKWRILSHAEGNPFYVEEVIRSLIDSGAIVQDEATGRWQATQDVSSIPIPDTLHGVLMARIDRLQEEAKRVLQLAAVIGRIFLHRVLSAIAQQELELEGHLITLQREEMIRERTRLPELEYIFKHELTREAAYNGLLKKERRVFHRQVAETLEKLLPDRIEEQVELLAHHWERAEEPEKAINYLRQAGDRAVRMSANEEAIVHFTRTLELLKALPDTTERARQELELQSSLLLALSAVRGYGAPELVTHVTRALELGKQVGDAPQILLPLMALVAHHGYRAEYRRDHAYWEELLALAERIGDPLSRTLSHWLGWIALFLGEPARALDHQEQVIDFYDPQKHRSLIFSMGVDPGAMCLARTSSSLWLLGYPDQALKRGQEALALARKLDHPYTLALTQTVAGMGLHEFRRDAQAIQASVEATLPLTAEKGFEYVEARAITAHGWVLVEQGRVEEGIAEMHRGFDAAQAIGQAMYTSMDLAKIGAAFGKLGQTDEALAVFSQALAQVERTDERYYEAEIHRLRGELLLMQADETEDEARFHQAERCFQHAIEVARRQQAKSWELRATVSLCRLWQMQGRQEQAREMLSEIYGWFTEGFDTVDLVEAKELLEELSSSDAR